MAGAGGGGAGEGGSQAARQAARKGRTDGRRKAACYLAAERNAAAAAAAALRWKRHFLLSVRFALSLSSVSGRRTEGGRMKSPRKQRLSPLLLFLLVAYLARRPRTLFPLSLSLWANGSSTQLLILQKKWRRAWARAGARNAGKAFSHSSPPQFMP